MYLFDNDIRKIALQRNLALEMIKDDFAHASRLAFGDKKNVAIRADMIFGNLGSFSNAGDLKILLENSVVVIDKLKLEGNFETVLVNSSIIVNNMYKIIKNVIETRVINEETIKEIEKTFIDLVAEEERIKGLKFFTNNFVLIYYDGTSIINRSFTKPADIGQYIHDNKINLNFPNISIINQKGSLRDIKIDNDPNLIKTGRYSAYTQRFGNNEAYDIYTNSDKFLILLNMKIMKEKKIFIGDDVTTIEGKQPLKFLFSNANENFKSTLPQQLFGKKNVNKFNDLLGLNVKPELRVIKSEKHDEIFSNFEFDLIEHTKNYHEKEEKYNPLGLLGKKKSQKSPKNDPLGLSIENKIDEFFMGSLDEILSTDDDEQNIYEPKLYYKNLTLYLISKNSKLHNEGSFEGRILYTKQMHYYDSLINDIKIIKRNYYLANNNKKMTEGQFVELLIKSVEDQIDKYKNMPVIYNKLQKIFNDLIDSGKY